MSGEWTSFRLGNTCTKIGSGATPKGGKEVYLEVGSFSLIRSQNIYTDGFTRSGLAYIDEKAANDLSNVEVLPEDILLNITGDSVARVCQVPADVLPARVNQHVAIIRPDPNKLSARFIRYWLSSPKAQAHLLALASAGATRNALTKLMIEDLNVSAPKRLSEQNAIAHILTTLDDKIEINRKINETLESMARSVFKSWFIDFDPVRAKMDGSWKKGQSLPCLPVELFDLFPSSLEESGECECPVGWNRVPASELIEFNPTERLSKGVSAPYLEMSALPTSGSWPDQWVAREFGSGTKFTNGDALLARITPCLENGKTAFIQCLPQNVVGWGSTEYIVMRAKGSVPRPVSYLLARDPDFRAKAILSMTGTSGRQRAQVEDISRFPLFNPGLNHPLWDYLGTLIGPIFSKIKIASEEVVTLKRLRDALLPKLISGDLQIRDPDKFLSGIRI